MLYLLDLRLREIKQVNDVPFGGVSIFFFGDILQLRPVCSAYIFEEPINENFKLAHLVASLWSKFKIVLLKTNHRQGEDKLYADLLNRVRIGEIKEEDIQALQKRVRRENDPDIPKDALVVTCTNKEVNRINEERLEAIDNIEYKNESLNQKNSKKLFQPKTDSSGAVSGTPLQKTLRLKIGAKVMLTYNLDTCDCLTNGAFGEVVGFSFNANGGMKEIHVHFYNSDCGKNMLKKFINLQEKYPGKNVVPIKPIEFTYSLSKKSSNGVSNASIIQFPLRLAFASTAHKVQGLTVKKPNCLVVDLRSVRESAQAYVILSRVQAISQLYILESVSEEKITASITALSELKRMEKVAINLQIVNKTSIVSCNIRSFQKNFHHLISAKDSCRALVLCLQETWIIPCTKNDYWVSGWIQHNNSVGRGKGIATLYKLPFSFHLDVKRPHYQLTKLTSLNIDVINVYRSTDTDTKMFLTDIKKIISDKKTLIIGDFNLCFLSETHHEIFQFLESWGFHQLVKHPTHIKGRMIDLAFIKSYMEEENYKLLQQSPFFTDHDLLEFSSGKHLQLKL